jgi:SAM-dependent methyltransferase
LVTSLFASDASFDLVVASLVLHHVRDWALPLEELRLVLTSDGPLVFSTHHPRIYAQSHSRDDYFATKQVTGVWTKGAGSY